MDKENKSISMLIREHRKELCKRICFEILDKMFLFSLILLNAVIWVILLHQ